MQTSLNIFFQRLEIVVKIYGLDGIQGLARELGFGSPEKLYRLGRDPDNKPSVDILIALTNKFENLNVRWFLTGLGSPQTGESMMKVMEPSGSSGLSEKVDELDRRLSNIEKKINPE